MGLFRKKLFYLVDKSNWSIKWDGHYITKNQGMKLKARTVSELGEARNSIIHFGYIGLYFQYMGDVMLHKKNKIVVTAFHLTEDYVHVIETTPDIFANVDFVQTSTTLTKKRLLDLHVEPNKIKVIPLGVDTKTFSPASEETKKLFRRDYGIPQDSFVIGSFQKDGNGWEEGNDPKLIKGPDIFCDAMEKLIGKMPLFVLLTGPARGYVKNRLNKSGIPYKHFYIDDYRMINEYYKVIDAYVVASRIEGGPKAIAESWASGIPLISTKMGMAPDIISDGEDGLLADIEDSGQIANHVLELYENKELYNTLSANGPIKSKEYDWKVIANRYFDEIYSKLL